MSKSVEITQKNKKISSSAKKPKLLYKYDENSKIEICLDEVGRGPLFGRLYTAAVVLPVNHSLFDETDIKDSKKFSSKEKMKRVAEYIINNCLAYHIDYIDAGVIDEINILQSVYRSMHECIKNILEKISNIQPEINNNNNNENILILVDGNSFRPYCVYKEQTGEIQQISHVTIEQGDAKYIGIAAASIIAKVAHDDYIHKLCIEYPILVERYDLANNVGYGTKKHLDGIREHGITEFHRKTYGICKTSIVTPLLTPEYNNIISSFNS